MPEFVSAVENGRVISVTPALAQSAGLQVVDQPATDRGGRPLPPRPRERKAPAAKPASKKSATRKRAASKKSSATVAAKSTGGAAAATPEEAS